MASLDAHALRPPASTPRAIWHFKPPALGGFFCSGGKSGSGLKPHHVLQHDSRSNKNGYLVHARALMQDRSYRLGEAMGVSYAYDKGKVAELPKDRER